jgi:hypothetical protein
VCERLLEFQTTLSSIASSALENMWRRQPLRYSRQCLESWNSLCVTVERSQQLPGPRGAVERVRRVVKP